MELGDQEKEPRPTKVVCLDKTPDPANFSESSVYIYSFEKLLGTWNSQVSGILAQGGTENKVSPLALESKRAKHWVYASIKASKETSRPLFPTLFIGFYFSYLSHKTCNHKGHHLLSIYSWDFVLNIISFAHSVLFCFSFCFVPGIHCTQCFNPHFIDGITEVDKIEEFTQIHTATQVTDHRFEFESPWP